MWPTRRALALAIGAMIAVPTLICGGTGMVGLVLPAEIALSTTMRLDAPPERVFTHLHDFEGIDAWWTTAMQRHAEQSGAEVAMQVVHVAGSPSAGPGCTIDFIAGGMTAETWTILEVEPGRQVIYDVDFKMMRVERTLALAADGDGSVLTWAETGRISNPWMRVMAAAMGEDGAIENFRDAAEALDQVAQASPK